MKEYASDAGRGPLDVNEVVEASIESDISFVLLPQLSISHKWMSESGKARLQFQLGLSTLKSWLGPIPSS